MDYLLAAVLLLAVGIGLFWLSRALKKKLGLVVVSEKTDRGRLYRIGESRPAASSPAASGAFGNGDQDRP